MPGRCQVCDTQVASYSDPESRIQVCETRLVGEDSGQGGDPRMSLVFACHFRGYLGIARWVGLIGAGRWGTERTSLCLDGPGPWLIAVRKFGECDRRTDTEDGLLCRERDR